MMQARESLAAKCSCPHVARAIMHVLEATTAMVPPDPFCRGGAGKDLDALADVAQAAGRMLLGCHARGPALRGIVIDALSSLPLPAPSLEAVMVHSAVDLAQLERDMLEPLRAIEGENHPYITGFVCQAIMHRFYTAFSGELAAAEDPRALRNSLVTGTCLECVDSCTDDWKSRLGQRIAHVPALVLTSDNDESRIDDDLRRDIDCRISAVSQDVRDVFREYTGLPPGFLGWHDVPVLEEGGLDDILAEPPASARKERVCVLCGGGAAATAFDIVKKAGGDKNKIQMRGDPGDLDLYLLSDGCPPSDRRRIALSAIAHLLRLACSTWRVQGPVLLQRTLNAITVIFNGQMGENKKKWKRVALQFNVRLYVDTEQLLTTYDLDPCRFAFDGEKMWSTRCGIWSAMNGVAYVNPLLPSTPRRLIKYAHKGYTVVCTLSSELETSVRAVQRGLRFGDEGARSLFFRRPWSVWAIVGAEHIIRGRSGGALMWRTVDQSALDAARCMMQSDDLESWESDDLESWESSLRMGVEYANRRIMFECAYSRERGVSDLATALRRAMESPRFGPPECSGTGGDMFADVEKLPEADGGFRLRDPTLRDMVFDDAFYI